MLPPNVFLGETLTYFYVKHKNHAVSNNYAIADIPLSRPGRPDQDTLLEELKGAQDDWKDIGRELGLEDSEITEIDEKLSPLDSLKKVLAIAQEKERLTWTKVIGALQNEKHHDLTVRLRTKYRGTFLGCNTRNTPSMFELRYKVLNSV